jgi:Ser/Thr protein kinase RdoA (MazF antagonist)
MNLTHRVDSPAGSYVLRIYQAVSDPARIRHEHSVMQYLSGAGLSFHVPAPLRAVTGATLVTVGGVSASLSPFCAGEHADDASVADVRAIGAGLGELSAALGGCAEPVGIPRYRELGRVHPNVADPEAALRESPFTSDQRERLLGLLETVRTGVPRLYGSLPQQVIHGDYTRENSLLVGGRVSAVLDFEFSNGDLRALDYATGLAGGPAALWEHPDPWLMPEAFTRGYTAHQALAPEEIAALPMLIRLRRIERLMQFIGRYRQGHDSANLLGIMANWVLRADEWLGVNGAELVRRAAAWAR